MYGWNHCVKSVQIRSFLWSVFSLIWTEYVETQTRKNSVFGHFLYGESQGNPLLITEKIMRIIN